MRRSRRRFWNPADEGGPDAGAAFHTLYTCLVTVAQLLAPFTPFVAEELWRNLAAGRGEPDSVHLTDYPVAEDLPSIDRARCGHGAACVQIVGARPPGVEPTRRCGVRQPLAEAVVHAAGDRAALDPLLPIIADELNVKRVVFAESATEVSDWRAKPNFKVLGPRLGPRVKEVAAELEADDGRMASALAQGKPVTVSTSSGEVEEVGAEAVDLVQQTQPGWGAASDGSVTVALELEITPELRLEGLAREIVRVVQDARKAAGLDVSDRIVLGLEAGGDLSEALDAFADVIASETLATELVRGQIDDAALRQQAEVQDSRIVVTLRKA